MSLVVAKDLSLRYGPKVLLDRASFSITPHDRIGLVGPNGSGKSSLLRILAGTLEPDGGTVQLVRKARAGYLPQEVSEMWPGSLVSGVLASVPGRSQLESRIASAESALSSSTNVGDTMRNGSYGVPESAEEIGAELAELHDELLRHDELYGRHRAEHILLGLGFSAGQLERPAAELSGGWRMRAHLAALLLQDPELLLLDEPTNHLDVPTLGFFDGFLRRSRKALVLVSHDREFLDRQIGRVLSFEPEGLRTYAGNYEDYLAQRAAEEERLQASAERQEKRRAQTLAFIDRFRAKSSKARQVQSRIKQLEKEEKVEVREQRATVRFRFPDAPRSGREVARFEHVAKSYGSRVVFRSLDAQVLRGDRIAVIGLNGAGKTTLLKLLGGEIAPDAGTIALGHNVRLGYFAQHHAELLDASRTVLEEVAQLVPDKPQSWVRSILGAFLFSGDDVDKRIAVLSGGERARVALARLLVVPSNFLLMDEPTNHLDLDSSEALIEALTGYEGTLLFVSHNRSFVNGLATHVWEVRDGTIDAQPGDLDDWEARQAQAAEPTDEGPHTAQPRPRADARRERAKERERRAQALGPLRKRVEQLEADVEKREAEKKQAEALLSDPAVFADPERSTAFVTSYRDAQRALDELYAEWEAAQEELQQAEARLETS